MADDPHRCLQREAILRERRADFSRRARRTCRSGSRAVARFVDAESRDGLRQAEQKLGAILDRLRRLRPPYKRGLWRAALRHADRVRGELDVLVDRWGTLTATEANSLSRRAEASARDAVRAFAGFGLTDCARLF